MVSFAQFARDALLRLAGLDPLPQRPLLTAASAQPIKKQRGRREYLRGEVFASGTGWLVRPAGNQGSGVLRSMSEANCFIVLPEECTGVAVGDPVMVQLFDGLF
jgi:molybdopterin molybdotransferase